MIKCLFLISLFSLAAGVAPAITVTVAPTSGTAGNAITDSIGDAISQINAAADATNSIILRSTEGALVQPADTLWALVDGKSVDFTAESGQPVVVLTSGNGRYMLAIAAGTNANNQTETVTFTNIAFVPQTGLSYTPNVADGISLGAGNYVFTNCVFSSNDGTDGVTSQEGDVAFTGTNCVGDDWIQMNGYNDLTLSHCTVTGAMDDAILIGGAIAPEVSTLFLNNGTCVANNGGAGIQVFDSNVALNLDGANGRVLIADNGKRAGTNDTGIKFFWDVGCSLTMNKTDIIGHNNGGMADFEGVPTMTISESRLAFNNSADLADVGNLSVWDVSEDSTTTLQAILLDNVTVHDTLATGNNQSILAVQGDLQPTQAYTIIDSVFSGAGDSFAGMVNATGATGASPAPVITFSAVVTSGPDAVADQGDLATATVHDDPVFASQDYTVGRSQENGAFLRPTAAAYSTAGSLGGQLRGGAPEAPARVVDFMLY